MAAFAPTASACAFVLLGCIALAAASCPVEYSSGDGTALPHEISGQQSPLLFGGTYAACTSGCQPRDSVWSNVCELDPEAYAVWGVCEDWQRAHALQLAGQISGGAMLHFNPCELYEAVGNRTLWVIGDSHVKGLFYSLRCFMLDFYDHSHTECAASDNATLQTQLELTSLQGHPYNTPPRCLHLKGSRGRICLVHSPIGDYFVADDPKVHLWDTNPIGDHFVPDGPKYPGTLQLLQQEFVAPEDILYIAVGRWHANNCEGIHPTYVTSLEKIGEYVEEHSASLPNVFFGVTPHDHTKCDGLTLNFSVPFCLPAEEGEYDLAMQPKMAEIAHRIMGGHGIPVIDFYNTSMALFDGHVTAKQSIAGIIDCLHFCRPGLGEIMVWDLYTAIASRKLSPEPPAPADAQARECVYVEPVLPKPFGPSINSAPDQAIDHRDAWGTDAWGLFNSAPDQVIEIDTVGTDAWGTDAWGYSLGANRK